MSETYLERVIYMTPEAIKQHFEGAVDGKGEFGEFIANADNETLEKIGDCAYWDDRIWDIFNVVLLDAANYIYKKSVEILARRPDSAAALLDLCRMADSWRTVRYE